MITMVPPQSRTVWSQGELEVLWRQLEARITPWTRVLNMPRDVFNSMDVGARAFISHSFWSFVQEPVMFCLDGTGSNQVFLGNARHFLENGGFVMHVEGSVPIWLAHDNTDAPGCLPVAPEPVAASTPAASTTKRIPRPPNAYILYRKDRHHLVKEANPNITNNEISQILGSAWNGESRAIRQEYKEMADKIKKDLLAKHPDYQYKPRKSSEKKRRARRNTVSNASAQVDGGDATVSSPDSI